LGLLYANALLEPDGQRLPERIAAAEAAINERLKAIAHQDNTEKMALVDALRALQALRSRRVERKSLGRAASFYLEAALPLWKVMISLLQHGRVTCWCNELSPIHERNSPKDREDVQYLAKTAQLNPTVLRERYDKELRRFLANEARHDLTIKLRSELLPSASANRS
jgi:hypothetical protein